MVAVIAPVRGQIESDRQALLPGCKIAAIEGIGFFSGGKTGILPDGPRLPRIHAAAYSAGKGAETGKAGVNVLDVLSRIERLYRNPLGRLPCEIAPLHFLFGQGLPVADSRLVSHYSTSRSEEHTSELQSLMRISYAVFCLNTKNNKHQ